MLSGKTVFISGVARGQGRSHALTVAREGGQVVGIDICGQIEGLAYPLATEADLAETVRQVEDLDARIVVGIADVRDQQAIDEVVDQGLAAFGRLDGVVANAGLWDLGPSLWETTEELWTTVIDATLSGAWRVVKATAPHLVRERSGSIVLISSVNGLEASVNYASYVVAKHGVIGLMRQAAYELAQHGVRVNAVAPGAIDTPIWNNAMGYQVFGAADREEAIGAVYGFHALAGRSALPPQATSNAVAWLLSDLSEHVTGVTLAVDAGHLIQPGWNGAPQTEGPVADRYRPPASTPE